MFDILKITIGLVDQFKIGECIIVFGNDLLEIVELVFIDDADQHRLFRPGVCTDGIDLRAAMVQLRKYFLHDLLFVGGDHGKFVGSFCGFQHKIANKCGNKAVHHAQRHGLVVQRAVSVYKDGGNGHDTIENKGDHKEIGFRLDLVDIPGNNVRSAGGGVITETYAVNNAAEHAAEDHRVDGIMSRRVVLDKGRVPCLNQQERSGIHDGKQHGPDRELLIHQEIGQHGQRNVNEQRHIADAKAGLVLHHGGDAVEPRRGKLIVNDENVIDKCQ